VAVLIETSHDSSVGTTTGYSNPGMGKIFSLLHSVQTGSEADPASYPMGTGGSFRGGGDAAGV
jgi:hypothetical protein